MNLGSTVGETAWSAHEAVIRRFEDAWRGNEHPDVGDFLVPESSHSVRLLVELVHIDLEFRLRAGEDARVEEYIARFSELGEPEVLLDLLAAEFALRNRHGDSAWPEEFWLRFPQHMTELRARLPAEGITGWFHATRPAERPGAPLGGPPVISGYNIEGELGRGGMGVVYKARDLLLHRTVAVKTFATVPRPESCVRFAREAESIARLDHPHIVPVYEVGEWHTPDGGPTVPYFVMKWYPGGSLDAAPAGSDAPPPVHAKTVELIARAVHHAHQRGVLHRDLKPSNILLDDAGRPHVADFGLAGRVNSDTPTLTAVVAGTPAYMAPEQARSPKEVSTAADVYGLGRNPLPPTHRATTVCGGNATGDARPRCARASGKPRDHQPCDPTRLGHNLLEVLGQRPFAAAMRGGFELADDLERWRKGLPIAARPVRTWELAWRRVRKHPIVTAMVVTTVLSLVGTVAVLADSNDRISAKEREAQLAYLRECAMRYKLEEALARDQTTRRELEDTLRREQRAVYLERVAAVGRLYSANQLAEAWALLDQCPEQFRGWEWRYLDSLRRANTVAFTGHLAVVWKVGFLADGRLMSTDVHGTIKVWSVSNQKCERTWRFNSPPIETLAVHPKKSWCAIADANGVSVRDAETGRQIAQLAGANWVVFSPDGTRAATADKSTVRIWIVPESEAEMAAQVHGDCNLAWEQAGELKGHESPVIAGVFTQDGKQLITSSIDRSIRTWDLTTGDQLARRSVPLPVTGLALVAGGKILAESHHGSVLFTDIATGEVRDRLEHPASERPAVVSTRDQRAVAISGANGEVIVWDAASRRTTRVFRGHPGRVVALAFGPNQQLASCGTDQTVRLWDVAQEPGARTLAWVGDGMGGIAISPDGVFAAVGPRTDESEGAKALVLDAATGRELHRVSCWYDVGFHPTTGRLVTRRQRGVIVSDPATGSEIWSKSLPESPNAGTTIPLPGRRLALSADGEFIAIWDRRVGGVHLWHADGSVAGLIDLGPDLVNTIAFTPDSSRLAIATPKTVMMWDVATRTRLNWGEGVTGSTAMAFSPNGQWLVTVDRDRAVRLRDAATGREIRRFPGNALQVNVLTFSPDSTRLVTGGADRTVRVWDVETGRELLSLPGVTHAVTGIVWDGPRNRIYALDHAARVWDTKDK